MKKETHEKVKKSIELLGYLIIFLSLSFFIVKNYTNNFGMAIEQNADTFVEGFDSLPTRWTPGTTQLNSFIEKGLNLEFRGIQFSQPASEKIPLNHPDMKFNQDNGAIWFRIKLNNDNYSQDEFLPFLLIGKLLIFKGATQEGQMDDNGNNAPPPISNGKDIFVGSYYSGEYAGHHWESGDYKKIGTWNKGEWHEVLINWWKSEEDCEDTPEYIVAITVDNQIIPANSAFGCDSNCDTWTMWFCDDYPFPVTSSGNLIIMPSAADISYFAKDSSAQTKSGFFIDKIAVSKADLNSFMYNISSESILYSNPVYWSETFANISISNQPSTQTLIPNLKSKCMTFNKPNQNGLVSVSPQNFGSLNVAISGNDLVINNIQNELSTRITFYLNCSGGFNSDIQRISLDIGNPNIFQFYFTANNNTEINITMSKNSQRNVTYFVQNINREANALLHDVTGESIVSEMHFPEINESQGKFKIKISSNSQPGPNTLTLRITDDVTSEYITGKINIKVLGDNQAPIIEDYSPKEQKLKINVSKNIAFKQTCSDDQKANLIYSWYINNSLITHAENYTATFNKAGYYVVKFVVSDTELTSQRIWEIEVVEPSEHNQDNNQNNNDSEQQTQQSVCGNNIVEPGEDCDTTKRRSGCIGQCLANCKCTGTTQNNSQSQSEVQNNNSQSTQQQSSQAQTGQSSSSQSSGSSSAEQGHQNPEEQAEGGAASTAAGGTSENQQNGQGVKKAPQNKQTAAKSQKGIVQASPEDKIFKALLWILAGLSIIPFILIAASRFSKIEPKAKEIPKIKNPNYNYQKLFNIVNWYKSKGMSANAVYNMLLRMGFDKQHAYSLIYQIFYKRK